MISRVCSLLRMQPPVKEDEGLLFASGGDVPASVAGYQPGCIFQHTDGGAGTVLYINEGTLASCTFNALTGGAGAATLSALTDVGAVLGYAAGKVLVADGTDYEEVAIGGDATLAANGALTIAANAVETTMILNANVTLAKVQILAATKFIIGAAAGNQEVTLSGDVTMDEDGVVEIAAGIIEDGMLEGLA
ncbi:unnamed protein product, partial [marine sediment metagenome]